MGKDYSSLFDWYLNKVKPPVLEVYADKEADLLYYKWKEEIPFYPKGEVYIKQGDEFFTLVPTTDFQSQKVADGVPVNILIEKSIYYTVDVKKRM